MITVEIESDTITPALEELTRLLGDLTPVMQEIGEYLVESTKRRFTEGTAPDGTPWAPKSPATIEAYGGRRSNRIEIRPLFGPTGLLSRLIAYEASPEAVAWGSDRIYSATMQFGAAKGAFGTTSRGSPIPWGNIPARPFLGISPADETAILDIIGEWIERAAQPGA